MTDVTLTDPNAVSPQTRTLIRGGGISLIGNTVQAGLNFAFLWYLARVLGAAGLGVYTLGLSIVSIAMIFALLGMDRAIVKFVAHYMALGDPEKARGVIVSTFRIYGTFSVLISLAVYWGADFINVKFFQDPDLVPVLRWMSIYLVAYGWVILLVNIPLAFRRIDYQALLQQVFLPLGKLLMAVLLILILGKSLLSFVYATVIIAILTAGLALWYLFRFQPFRKLFAVKSEFSTNIILKFSIPVFFTQLLNRTEGQLSFLFLGSLAAMSDVGVYRVSSRITLPMSMMIMALFSIFSPIIASLYAQGDIQQIEELYRNTTRWLLSVAFPIFLVIVLIPEELLRVFGEEFVMAAGVLILIGVAQLVNAATGPAGAILQMTKYVSLNLGNALLILPTTIFLQFRLIPIYGLMGAAIADGVGIILLNILRLVEVFFLLKIHPINRALAKPVVAAILTGIISYWGLQYGPEAYILRIVAVIGFVFITYIAFIFLLKLDDTDKAIVEMGRNFSTRKLSNVAQSVRKSFR